MIKCFKMFIFKDLSECEAGDVDLLYLSTSLVNGFARSEFIMSIRHKDWPAAEGAVPVHESHISPDSNQ